jgi:Protein of unknown function (DUF3102)
MTRRDISSSAGSGKPALTAHITAIRTLGKQTIANVIEIGRRLTECKKLVSARDWGCWLDKEFRWSERHARNFMYAYELAESKSENFSELDLPISAIYLLAAPSTPEPVRAEILGRAKAAEKVKHKEIKRKIAEAKSRKQPRQRSSSKSDVGTPPLLKDAIAFADATTAGGRTKAAVFAPDTTDESVRLQARIGELEDDKRQLEIKNSALQSEVEEVWLSSDIYLNATREQRQQFLTGIGVDLLLNDLPADMLAELHKRLVAQYRGEPKRPLNPTEAALAQVAADDGLNILDYLRRSPPELSPVETKAIVAAINSKNCDTSWRIDPDGRGGFHMVTLDTAGKVDTSHTPERIEDLLAMSRDFDIDVEKIRRDATRPPPQGTITRH